MKLIMIESRICSHSTQSRQRSVLWAPAPSRFGFSPSIVGDQPTEAADAISADIPNTRIMTVLNSESKRSTPTGSVLSRWMDEWVGACRYSRYILSLSE